MLAWFANHTVRSPADLKDPRLEVITTDLRGLPPLTIVNAEIDPLRDDGALLETALQRAGVQVKRRLYPGVAHALFGMAAVVQKAKDAQGYAGQRLRAAFEAG